MKKNFFHVLLYISLFLLLFLFLFTNKILIDTNIGLNIAPRQTFFTFFQGWYDLMYLGINNSVVYSYIFPLGFMYWLGSFLGSIPVVQVFILSLFLTLTFFSFSLFIKEEIGKESPYIYIGSLFYLCNTYVLLIFGTIAFLLPYAVLPLQLYFLRKILVEKNYLRFCIGFGFASLVMGGMNPPLSAINIIVIFFYLLHVLFKEKLFRDIITWSKKLCITMIFVLTMNAFWVIGDIAYYASISSAGFAAVLSEPLSMQNANSSYLNVFRGLGIWSFSQSNYNYASIYLENPFFQISLFVIPIIVFFVILQNKKIAKQNIFIIMLMLLAVAMGVGSNQGMFKEIYVWAYDHVPLFSMFRSSFKFTAIYMFCLAFFLTLFISSLKKGKKKLVISISVIFIICVNFFPLFTKQIFEKEKQISDIPSYYYDIEKYFAYDPSEYRVLLMPPQNFAVYTWGFTAGNPEIVWKKPLVAQQGSTLDYSNKIVSDLYRSILNKDYNRANQLMGDLNVKYIVQRNDFDWYFYKKTSASPENIRAILQPYKKIETFGMLDLYQINEETATSVINSPNVTFQAIGSSKYRIYIKNVQYVYQLNFLESFHKDWNLYVKKHPDTSWCDPLEVSQKENRVECYSKTVGLADIAQEVNMLFEKPFAASSHKLLTGYANTWMIQPSEIIKNYSTDYYKKNADGSIDIEIIAYFKQQVYLYIGLGISFASILLSSIYLLYCTFKKKYEKKHKK